MYNTVFFTLWIYVFIELESLGWLQTDCVTAPLFRYNGEFVSFVKNGNSLVFP